MTHTDVTIVLFSNFEFIKKKEKGLVRNVVVWRWSEGNVTQKKLGFIKQTHQSVWFWLGTGMGKSYGRGRAF